MTKKDSIDKLLYQYGEKAFEKKYDTEIEKYEEEMEKENIKMDISFEEFWENKDKVKKTINKKKKRKSKVFSIIAASLIIGVIIVGPSNVVTYADYIYHKIIDVFKEGTNIKYKDDFSKKEDFIIQKLQYIPDDFELIEESNVRETPNEYYSYYTSKTTEDHILYNQSLIKKDSITLDTENAKTYEKRIDDKKVFVVEKDGFNTFLSEDNQYIYLLEGNVDVEELERMFISIFK